MPGSPPCCSMSGACSAAAAAARAASCSTVEDEQSGAGGSTQRAAGAESACQATQWRTPFPRRYAHHSTPQHAQPLPLARACSISSLRSRSTRLRMTNHCNVTAITVQPAPTMAEIQAICGRQQQTQACNSVRGTPQASLAAAQGVCSGARQQHAEQRLKHMHLAACITQQAAHASHLAQGGVVPMEAAAALLDDEHAAGGGRIRRARSATAQRKPACLPGMACSTCERRLASAGSHSACFQTDRPDRLIPDQSPDDKRGDEDKQGQHVVRPVVGAR